MQSEPLSTTTYTVFERVVADAASRGLSLRVAGSLGVLLHCPQQIIPFSRRRAPICNFDLAAFSSDRKAINELLLEHGFRLDRHYSTGIHRATYLSAQHGFRCDVCFDCLPFAHTIPLGSRLLVNEPTLPPAELLLQKLQIVQPEWKHVCDVQTLLAEHELASNDNDAVNAEVIAQLCARHWGLAATVVETAEICSQFTRGARDIPEEVRERIIVRLELLRKLIDKQPKRWRWWMRRLVGKRIRWYRPVEHNVQTPIARRR